MNDALVPELDVVPEWVCAPELLMDTLTLCVWSEAAEVEPLHVLEASKEIL